MAINYIVIKLFFIVRVTTWLRHLYVFITFAWRPSLSVHLMHKCKCIEHSSPPLGLWRYFILLVVSRRIFLDTKWKKVFSLSLFSLLMYSKVAAVYEVMKLLHKKKLSFIEHFSPSLLHKNCCNILSSLQSIDEITGLVLKIMQKWLLIFHSHWIASFKRVLLLFVHLFSSPFAAFISSVYLHSDFTHLGDTEKKNKLHQQMSWLVIDMYTRECDHNNGEKCRNVHLYNN